MSREMTDLKACLQFDPSFEIWAHGEGFNTTRSEHGPIHYEDRDCEMAWLGWNGNTRATPSTNPPEISSKLVGDDEGGAVAWKYHVHYKDGGSSNWCYGEIKPKTIPRDSTLEAIPLYTHPQEHS